MELIGSAAANGVLLAHQGGWDEILYVAAPLAVFAVLLGIANSRAKRRAAARETDPRPGGGTASRS